MIVRTFQKVYPEMYIWESLIGTDFILVGFKDEKMFNYLTMENNFFIGGVREDISEIGFTGLPSVLSTFVMGADELPRYIGEGIIHTDDNAVLEFNMPQSLYESTSLMQIQGIEQFRCNPLNYLGNVTTNPADVNRIREEINNHYEAKLFAVKGKMYEIRNKKERAFEHYRKFLRLNPNNWELNTILLNHFLQKNVKNLLKKIKDLIIQSRLIRPFPVLIIY